MYKYGLRPAVTDSKGNQYLVMGFKSDKPLDYMSSAKIIKCKACDPQPVDTQGYTMQCTVCGTYESITN